MRAIVLSVLAGVFLLVGVTVIFGSWYTVDQGEVGVRTRNGAVIGTATAGLGFKTPLIDGVVKMSVRTEKMTFEKLQAYSKDIQSADVRVSINYRLNPAEVEHVYSTYGEKFADRIIVPIVSDQFKTVFGKFNAANVVQDRGRLGLETEAAITAALTGSGVIIENVNIENVDFSAEYEKSIEERMKAEVEVSKLQQNAEREKVQAQIAVTQANGRADSVRAAAKAQAEATLLAATAEAQATELKGKAEASAIDAKGRALRDNPALVGLVQAERWNGALPTTMVPGSGVPFLNVGK